MRKVKNSIKKMMALCLAAIMTLAMATTAFAADRIKTGNLTVNVNGPRWIWCAGTAATRRRIWAGT